MSYFGPSSLQETVDEVNEKARQRRASKEDTVCMFNAWLLYFSIISGPKVLPAIYKLDLYLSQTQFDQHFYQQ